MGEILYDYKNEDLISDSPKLRGKRSSSLHFEQSDLSCDITIGLESFKKDAAQRRRSRIFAPLIYLALEIGILWLIISLLNRTTNPKEWSSITIALFIGLFLYAVNKTKNIYARQKNYPKV